MQTSRADELSKRFPGFNGGYGHRKIIENISALVSLAFASRDGKPQPYSELKTASARLNEVRLWNALLRFGKPFDASQILLDYARRLDVELVLPFCKAASDNLETITTMESAQMSGVPKLVILRMMLDLYVKRLTSESAPTEAFGLPITDNMAKGIVAREMHELKTGISQASEVIIDIASRMGPVLQTEIRGDEDIMVLGDKIGSILRGSGYEEAVSIFRKECAMAPGLVSEKTLEQTNGAIEAIEVTMVFLYAHFHESPASKAEMMSWLADTGIRLRQISEMEHQAFEEMVPFEVSKQIAEAFLLEKLPTCKEPKQLAYCLLWLGLSRSKEAIPAMIEQLKDTAERKELGQERGPDIGGFVPRNSVSLYVAYALAAIGEPAIDPLIAASRSDDRELVKGAIASLFALGKEGNVLATEALFSLSTLEDPHASLWAERATRTIGWLKAYKEGKMPT